MPMTLAELQARHKAWIDHNFPRRASYYFVLGAQEELGELSAAELKKLENIRGGVHGHAAKAQDAIADTIFFLMGYASDHGWDLMTLLESTWDEISQRDWARFPGDGVSR